jgi:hypothetical protein
MAISYSPKRRISEMTDGRTKSNLVCCLNLAQHGDVSERERSLRRAETLYANLAFPDLEMYSRILEIRESFYSL